MYLQAKLSNLKQYKPKTSLRWFMFSYVSFYRRENAYAGCPLLSVNITFYAGSNKWHGWFTTWRFKFVLLFFQALAVVLPTWRKLYFGHLGTYVLLIPSDIHCFWADPSTWPESPYCPATSGHPCGVSPPSSRSDPRLRGTCMRKYDHKTMVRDTADIAACIIFSWLINQPLNRCFVQPL